MTLFLPRSATQRLWPWTANVERILRSVQPRPFAGPHVALASDYSGDHKASRFRAYCYSIMDTEASPEWPRRRQSMRQQYLPDGRRMSFKSLGDKYRQRALVPFLQAADTIYGHIVCLVVTKSFDNMSWRADPDHARHAAFLHARPSRVLHAHAIDPSGLDRCASTRCATRVGLICVIGGASGPMAPRLKGRTASGPVRRCGTARPPGNSSAVECGCARHVRSRGRRS
jgi:hypothetical protein